ncbi:6-hydroxynicotinate 3-monooxygenase precursor [Roseivivax sp. THAF40]|uniref:FAD binding domain-containing protein n=1 Tax=unclassified Roseivivax TaxID=2639302 RepID=UPI001268B6EF|nr:MULTISPECIES: FAD binding domain-containing protein [unclassified Roseivivax]QFS82814.1 6-hydroxynicotinate 3-monooxygenase precursor [Roseivivax sp. THAF197b]QFT46583.1 6-hydroxynicotinate 3-monooxygenase precursor [Roseivivax sp. THAF40]
MAGKAAIVGGSIGGLFAAAALKRAGWDVVVHERVNVPLAGRGAGIVTHPQLIDALERVGAETADLGVHVDERVAFDQQGRAHARMPYPQVVTSWDRTYQALRALVPDAQYRLGQALHRFDQDADGVTLHFEDGATERADVLIGTDGFRSVVRGQIAPEVQPVYAGYVVWRALANEADLDPGIRDRVFDMFGMFMPKGTQIVGYPIAGEGNDLRPGHRRYNFVWYVPTDVDDLDDMLTDAEGTRHAISIPPPLVREAVVKRAAQRAAEWLPDVFEHVLAKSERPFFTPIYDHLSPDFAQGRVAIAGDAACVARPHVGMGVTKAGGDALALGRHLSGVGPEGVEAALASYSAERVPAARAAHDRAQMLGRYIFADPATGHNRDGRNNPNQDEILRLTAVADFD